MSLLSAAKGFLSKSYSKSFPSDKPWHEKPGVRGLVPGTSSIKSLKMKKYGHAAKHLATDVAYWSTVGLPDMGFASGPAVKFLAHKALFPHGTDTESGKKKVIKKMKEAVHEYNYIRSL